MKILNTKDSLAAISSTINKGQGAFFTRFGDLDILFASGTSYNGQSYAGNRPYGGNKTIFSKPLQLELVEALTINEPNYLIGVSGAWENERGMREGVFASFSTKNHLIRKVRQFRNDATFLSPVLFQYIATFRPTTFKQFVKKYFKGKIVFVGCAKAEHLQRLGINASVLIPTPEKDAYASIDQWWPQVEEEIKTADILLPGCGQASRVVTKRAWYVNSKMVSLDLGSIYDAFVPPTRTWLRMEQKRLMENYGTKV